jgi:ABC-2 type transport system ATP-binding protein
MIQVEGLTKYYGDHPAIVDLTFNAEVGEILGFLGPSAGKASVAGFDVVDQSLEVRRRVGYLPETVPLYPEMSVVEYLEFMGSLRRVSDLDGRIDAVLEEVHLEERADSFIGNLSKGLRQRVGLAQALLHEPDVLILDEPTIGLDPAQIIDVRKLIQEVGKSRTVLLSTHILSEAQQVCDRVLIINHGSIVVEDSPGHLQAQLAGAERLVVIAAAETSELIKALEGLPGVTEVAPGTQEGEVQVSCRPGNDARPMIARKVVEAGLDLLELRTVGVSLEDIFLQLTREEIPPQVEA